MSSAPHEALDAHRHAARGVAVGDEPPGAGALVGRGAASLGAVDLRMCLRRSTERESWATRPAITRT